jgi:hypothetical protein
LSVHNGEPFDINLCLWRSDEFFSYSKSWKQIFQDAFNIPWNTVPWISTVPNLYYKDTTFLSVGVNTLRYNHILRYNEMYQKIPNLVFLATSRDIFDNFFSKTGICMPLLICSSFTDLASVIMGCKGIIGTLSMPIALADAMWKPRLAITYGVHGDNAIAILNDRRFIYRTEDLEAFEWKTPSKYDLQ